MVDWTEYNVADVVVGAASSAIYIIADSGNYETAKGYDESEIIQDEFDGIVDFTEVNPFGEV